MDPATLPLGAHALFHTRDLDEARERVAAVFCPHRLETSGPGFDARHHHLAGRDLSLNYIDYGARTQIAPGELGFYLVQIPLSGAAEITQGRETYVSTPSRAAVLNPHLPTRMTWEAGTRQVLLQVQARAVEAQVGLRPAFSGGLDLAEGPGAVLRRLVLWLVAEADGGGSPLGSGLMARQIEATLIAGLLEAPHDQSAAIARQRAAPRPRHLRLAESFIEAHLDQPITLEEVASAAGISARGLQMAFQAHRGVSPLAFWRQMRLARAHADLCTAAPGTRVTDVALRWGFTHFGRFSQAYRQRYGLSPRDSLGA